MKKRVIFTLMFIVAMLLLNSCGTTEKKEYNSVIEKDKGKDYSTIKGKEVSFKSESGGLTINNKASFDLIVFAGRVDNGNVLGGIVKQGSRSFDLSKVKGIPSKGSILVRATSANRYIKNNYRVEESDVVFTGLVVYDLTNKDDRTELNVYSRVLDIDTTFIYVENTSPYVLELRLDEANGQKLATIKPRSGRKKIWLAPKEDGLKYDFWPTYIYVDPKTNEITPFAAQGYDEIDSDYPDTTGVNILTFSGPRSGKIGYKLGFIRLLNDTKTGLEFRNGKGNILPNQKGIRFTRPGNEGVFELEAASGSRLYSSLDLSTNQRKEIPINPVNIEAGVMYELLVTEVDGMYKYDIKTVGRKSIVEDAQISLFLEN